MEPKGCVLIKHLDACAVPASTLTVIAGSADDLDACRAAAAELRRANVSDRIR